LLNSQALSKIQLIILISVIIFPAIGGVAIYILEGGEDQSSETIKIGLPVDIGEIIGDTAWKSAIIAVEEINSKLTRTKRKTKR